MALASYILAGYFKRERKSNEAALKYFVLGALSSGILLYGISLLYGVTGTVQLAASSRPRCRRIWAQGNLLVPLGWICSPPGLFFKVAAAPFHVWTPDVYVGAPTPVTAFLAAASKAASFAILLRIFYRGCRGWRVDWQLVVAVVAVVTMIWGNLAALTQDNVKRLLAYSSIAHAGYVLIGVLALNEIGPVGGGLLPARLQLHHPRRLRHRHPARAPRVRRRDLRRLRRAGAAARRSSPR